MIMSSKLSRQLFSILTTVCFFQNNIRIANGDYIRVSSGSCEDSGYERIYDQSTCIEAAASFGYTITWGPHGGYSEVVNGCSVRYSSQLFLNPPDKCDPTFNTDHWAYTGK